MDFADRILELSKRVPKQLDHLATEEATDGVAALALDGEYGRGRAP